MNQEISYWIIHCCKTDCGSGCVGSCFVSGRRGILGFLWEVAQMRRLSRRLLGTTNSDTWRWKKWNDLKGSNFDKMHSSSDTSVVKDSRFEGAKTKSCSWMSKILPWHTAKKLWACQAHASIQKAFKWRPSIRLQIGNCSDYNDYSDRKYSFIDVHIPLYDPLVEPAFSAPRVYSYHETLK